MTQPEGTTAALIARLYEELNASKAECLQWRKDIDEERTIRQTHEARSRSLHRVLAKERSAYEAAESARIAWAERCIAIEKERDEQRARAGKAEDELTAEKNRHRDATAQASQWRADYVTVDRMLVKRTRERDEARRNFGIASRQFDELGAMLGQQAGESPIMAASRARQGRDEACEQLAEVEWAALERPAAGGPLLACCVICRGFKNDDAARRFFTSSDQLGHRPTCWFAKKEVAKEGAKPQVKSADDFNRGTLYVLYDALYSVTGTGKSDDSAWVNLERVKEPGKEAAKPPTLREQWKTKQAAYDHWLDACGYLFNWHSDSKDKTERYPFPKRDGIGVVTVKVGEPARPEPRFKVGERVTDKARLESWPVCLVEWRHDCWHYATPGGLWCREDSLLPAPKFAVGEWVTWGGSWSGEVTAREWGLSNRTEWIYTVARSPVGVDGGPVRTGEHAITAQTPQHKHDCKGCVFLGRWNRFDLYFCKDGEKNIGYRYGEHALDLGWDEQSEAGIEARRRAVARGLV